MNAPRLREADAYRSIREAIRAGWPSADYRDVRTLALDVKALAGVCPVSVATATLVIDAVAIGVRAGHWRGAENIRVGADVVFAAVEFCLRDPSKPVAMMLQLLAEGHAPAKGLGIDEEGLWGEQEREDRERDKSEPGVTP